MGTFFVVAEQPCPADIAHLRECREDVRIEYFGPIGPVEAFVTLVSRARNRAVRKRASLN